MINTTSIATIALEVSDCITATQENKKVYTTDTNIVGYTDISNRSIEVTNSANNKSIEFTPDEFIAKLNSGNLPDVPIVVTDNLSFEDSNFYNLPSNLTIKGELTLKDCNNITNIPTGLNVESLKIEKCLNLITLADDIIIKNNLSITECPIQELPDNLEINCLFIYECSVVLKYNIKVNKILILFNCPAITYLPTISDTIEDIKLSYCTNIFLPNLKIKGNLKVEHCGIYTIPEHMVIEGNFFISNCPNITSLPDKIEISGNLQINRCDMLTYLPEFWFSNMPKSLPFVNDEKHSITLIDSNIPKVAINKYYKRRLPCYISIIQESFYKRFTIEINKLLNNMIIFWQRLINDKKNITVTNITVAETKDLIQLLQKLINTRDFLNTITRSKLAIEVIDILQLISKGDVLREDILAIMHDAVASCEDRVLLRLADITFLPLLRQAENQSIIDKTGAALKKLAKQKLCADEISKYAIAYAKEKKPTEEVEFILDFKIKLADRFDLHFTNNSMNYYGVSNLKTSDVDKAYEEINIKVTKDYFDYLHSWEPWQKHQRRWLLQEYNNLPIKNDSEVNIKDDCCMITRKTKKDIKDPIIYNDRIYSYKEFCQWYINTGRDLINFEEPIDINNIFAIHVMQNLEHPL